MSKEDEPPQFSLDDEILSEDGRFDRLEVDIISVLLSTVLDEDLEKFADHLSVAPTATRAVDKGLSYGTLFARYTGRKRFELKIRKKGRDIAGNYYPRPLFSGHTTISQRRKSSDAAVYTNLCLNLTRFLRYQNLRQLAAHRATSLKDWIPELFADPSATGFVDEFSSDNNDNWLHPARERRIDKKWTMPVLRKYLIAVFKVVMSEMLRASKASDTSLSAETARLNLKRAEIYWEFRDSNPRATVNRIFTALGIISDSQRFRQLVTREGKLVGQAIEYSYKLADGVWVHIYAKTNKRIRFEIRYELKAAAKIIGGKHTTSNFREMVNFFTLLRNDAATRLQGFFSLLRDEGLPAEFPITATVFIHRFMSLVAEPSMSYLLLAALVHEKGIPVSKNSPFTPYLKKLARHKMLGCRNRVYRVTAKYRNALACLQQADLVPMLFPNLRRRTRTPIRRRRRPQE